MHMLRQVCVADAVTVKLCYYEATQSELIVVVERTD